MLLVVAATERELAPVEGARTAICGIGPVEAAAATARALAEERPSAVLHVGIAGARGLEPLTLVIGSEAVYCDAGRPVRARPRAPRTAGSSHGCRPPSPRPSSRPIGTSARVGGSHGVDVEAMEGFAVLRRVSSPACPPSRSASSRTRSTSRTGRAGASTTRSRCSPTTLPRLVAVASARELEGAPAAAAARDAHGRAGRRGGDPALRPPLPARAAARAAARCRRHARSRIDDGGKIVILARRRAGVHARVRLGLCDRRRRQAGPRDLAPRALLGTPPSCRPRSSSPGSRSSRSRGSRSSGWWCPS